LAVIEDLRAQVARHGFARVRSEQMRALVGDAALAGWADYAASWNDLAVDEHMADGGRYRRRRYAVLEAQPGRLTRLAHEPHFQALDYNRLNGGVDRWFEPITPQAAEGPLARRLVDLSLEVFAGLGPEVALRTEMHQFRIEARAGELGQPTPEGAHRDGVDWVLVMLVARRNVAAGVTDIFDPSGASLGSFTLLEPLDAVFIDDRRVFHGVTAITPVDPDQAAYRDVLVVTFRRRSD
jgi:hypothetical protein